MDLDTGGDEGSSMEPLYGATDRVMAAITAQLAELRDDTAPTATSAAAT